VVLEDGAITEEGTHAALLSRKGTYATLWAHQSGGFIED
jgi:ATP-binding cassette subfamily B multidrug efflux pump